MKIGRLEPTRVYWVISDICDICLLSGLDLKGCCGNLALTASNLITMSQNETPLLLLLNDVFFAMMYMHPAALNFFFPR